jgi:hypothetical protein
MKVLVHLNRVSSRTRDKSYLLQLKRGVSRRKVRCILEGDHAEAAKFLFFSSVQKVEIPARNRRTAAASADFVISHCGYSAERLV